MLRVHTIFKDNLASDALNYNWTDHAVDTIKKIIKVWFNSNIAKAILLFFKEDLSGDLHSYMPIGLKNNENTPNLENFKGPRGQAQIICVEPSENDFETLSCSFRFKDDNNFVVRIMKKNFWNGNEVFKLMRTGIASFAKEYFITRKGTGKRKLCRTLEDRWLVKTTPNKKSAKRKIAKKVTAKKATAKKATAKKTSAKKTTAKKTTAKKAIAKKKTVK